ncbi:MAG TPA: Gfo/Idh/MocA family oxidoreductase, partial [Chitinophagaceae bacterium]|nr:Gfo/Idh/MocA family oxidoreductase [Chitinophagaceae bacterium]
MNILLIGPGSVGKRHFRNILTLGYKNISIVSHSKFADDEFTGIPVFKSVEEATETNLFDVAFICTSTAVHIEQLITLLQKQVQLIYIEKPLSNSLKNINKIFELSSSY